MRPDLPAPFGPTTKSGAAVEMGSCNNDPLVRGTEVWNVGSTASEVIVFFPAMCASSQVGRQDHELADLSGIREVRLTIQRDLHNLTK